MDINGPMRIGVLHIDGADGWELHFDFREEFQALDLQQQAEEFQRYLTTLASEIASLPEDDRDRQGMLLVQQLSEQLLEYIALGDLALNETIKVQVEQSAAVTSLSDLINSRP
ncbi:MAG: transcriptional regulator [Gammaproteobacteria bacterium]|nr:transcriptional regulator [Gammaproteobacteria bacterium]